MQPNNPNQPPNYNPNQPPVTQPPNYNPNYPPQQPYYGPPPVAPRKKGMPGCLVALLVVIAVIVVLGVVGVVTGVVTGSFSFGPMQVTDATMAKGFSNNQAVNPTTTFSPTDNPFYCVVKVQNTTAGATLKGVWTAVDVGSTQNKEIASKTLNLDSGNNYVAHFDLSLPNDLPTGKYKFEVYLNDTLARTLDFTVQ